MELNIDRGLKSYDVKDADGTLIGTIRFNPSDIGLAGRMEEARARIAEITAAPVTGPEDLVEWDRQVRHWFDYIFGTPVSDVFFAGVSSLAFCEDGSLVAEAVLDAISALRDPELSPQEQTLACLEILYPDWKRLPDLSAATQAAMVFINCGKPVEAAVPKPALVDWDTDAAIMAPAVDKVLGYSCRRCAYLHWWEFIGAFGCIGDGQFAQVVSIRNKRLHGKKLDKAEQEFVRNNPDLVTLPKHKLTSAEEEFFKSLGV